MSRFVFFSFHFEKDIWRVNQIRNSWVTNRSAGYIDAAAFEAVRRRGKQAVYAWIDRQLEGTTVTAVLIGQDTAERDYVHYEIQRSIERNNGLVPIHLNNMLDHNSETDWFQGRNPLEDYDEESSNWLYRTTLADRYPAYDWIHDNGYDNFGDWVEEAYQIARD